MSKADDYQWLVDRRSKVQSLRRNPWHRLCRSSYRTAVFVIRTYGGVGGERP